VVAYAAGAVEETMNGGGILIRDKNFAKVASLLDRLQKDESLRKNVVLSQKKALEKFGRENVSRILLSHVQKVTKS
jgi:glycosyltransferase involved in cell wall biosynthesis